MSLTVEALRDIIHRETWLSHGLPPEAICGFCEGVAEKVLRALPATVSSTVHVEPHMAKKLADARLTILAQYDPHLGDPRIRPSVVRQQVREIDALLGRQPTEFPIVFETD